MAQDGGRVGVVDRQSKEQCALCPFETMNRFMGRGSRGRSQRGVGDSKIYSRRHVSCTEEQTWKEVIRQNHMTEVEQERIPSVKSEEGDDSGTYE